MKNFAEKVTEARKLLGMSQLELAEILGTTNRTISTYERGVAFPRRKMLFKLADALQVSPDYLENDEIADPMYGIEKMPYVEETRQRFGAKAAKELDALLEKNIALFAGGALPQEAKDAYFEALMKAYITCKEKANAKFGRKAEDEV